jgi:hypothetical protein
MAAPADMFLLSSAKTHTGSACSLEEMTRYARREWVVTIFWLHQAFVDWPVDGSHFSCLRVPRLGTTRGAYRYATALEKLTS